MIKEDLVTPDFIVFQSVSEASSELWSVSELSKTKNWCNSQIIISDAAVSAIFWWFPPVSIIGGAASSLITANSGDCNKIEEDNFQPIGPYPGVITPDFDTTYEPILIP